MTEIVMPQLSESMESGLLLNWLVEDGQTVAAGEELLEVETDKATVAVEADAAGVLDIVVGAGSTVAVGEVIARVGATVVAVNGNGNGNGNGAHPPSRDPGGAPVTPVARRLAHAHGVELRELTGTGPRGRITKDDVRAAAGIAAEPMLIGAAATAAAPSVVHSPAQPTPPTLNAVQPLTRLQQVVAQRMSAAKATVPHFQVQTEVSMGAALALRAELKAAVPEGMAAPSVNDMIVKAAALALTRHPLANGSYTEAGFQLHEHVNVGVAVAAEGALVVVTVPHADTKSLGRIAAETRALAERVRAGTVAPAELSGATFTVSNLGMFGMTAITPVINPPQAAILGVGAVRSVLARDADGEIIDSSLGTLTLSCDHRILYGADAARFLAEIRELLEHPLSLCL